jgi:hypothetical protein
MLSITLITLAVLALAGQASGQSEVVRDMSAITEVDYPPESGLFISLYEVPVTAQGKTVSCLV